MLFASGFLCRFGKTTLWEERYFVSSISYNLIETIHIAIPHLDIDVTKLFKMVYTHIPYCALLKAFSLARFHVFSAAVAVFDVIDVRIINNLALYVAKCKRSFMVKIKS